MASTIKPPTTAPKAAAAKPYNPANISFQPINQSGGTSEASSSPLLWVVVAFVAYQLMKK